MTVLFKGIDHIGIGYKVFGPMPIQPKVDNLRCDKISLTIDLPYHERELLKKTFKDLEKNDYCKKTSKTGGYYQSYSISLQDVLNFGIHGEKSILVQFDPHNGSYNYLRAEFNPDKASPPKVKAILDKILLNGYNRIINGKVTRFDETALIHFCEIDNLMFYMPNLQSSVTYKSSGKIETEYLGSMKAGSKKIFCIYDKTKEVMVKNAKAHPYSEEKELVPKYPIVRVEYR
nr:hypothetical protein [Desulfobacula sp.]